MSTISLFYALTPFAMGLFAIAGPRQTSVQNEKGTKKNKNSLYGASHNHFPFFFTVYNEISIALN